MIDSEDPHGARPRIDSSNAFHVLSSISIAPLYVKLSTNSSSTSNKYYGLEGNVNSSILVKGIIVCMRHKFSPFHIP